MNNKMPRAGAKEKLPHTPGPWYWKENKHADNIGIYKDATKPGDSWPSAYCIAFLDTIEGHTNQPISEAEANANLLASAPALLEAAEEAYTTLGLIRSSDFHLKEFLNGSPKMNLIRRRMEKLQAAISAAKGE